MRNIIIQFFLLFILSACFNNKGSIETIAPLDCDVYKVDINIDDTYYDSITGHISDTSFVILKEKCNVLLCKQNNRIQ